MKSTDNQTFGKKLNPVTRRLYIAAGVISLFLGILGIPLPLLPTTPFLLLSAWLFARSSERFYSWLIHHKYLGSYIRNYREKGGVSKKVKLYAISLLWITICISAFVALQIWWVSLLLIIIALGVTVHILSLRNIEPEERNRE